MILSTHFTTGAAIANYIDSPLLITILPFLFHFLLDTVPHWEYVDEIGELKQKKLQLTIDILAGPIIILMSTLLFYGADLRKIFWLFFGGLFGILPDGLSLLHAIFPKNKLLKKIFAFHLAIHSKKKMNWKIGLVFQAALNILAVVLIVLPKA